MKNCFEQKNRKKSILRIEVVEKAASNVKKKMLETLSFLRFSLGHLDTLIPPIMAVRSLESDKQHTTDMHRLAQTRGND